MELEFGALQADTVRADAVRFAREAVRKRGVGAIILTILGSAAFRAIVEAAISFVMNWLDSLDDGPAVNLIATREGRRKLRNVLAGSGDTQVYQAMFPPQRFRGAR